MGAQNMKGLVGGRGDLSSREMGEWQEGSAASKGEAAVCRVMTTPQEPPVSGRQSPAHTHFQSQLCRFSPLKMLRWGNAFLEGRFSLKTGGGTGHMQRLDSGKLIAKSSGRL